MLRCTFDDKITVRIMLARPTHRGVPSYEGCGGAHGECFLQDAGLLGKHAGLFS